MRYGCLISLCSLLAAGCNARLNTPQLEGEIKAGIEQQGYRIRVKSVTCPSGIDQQPGVVFNCVAELPSTATFNVEVRQLNDLGHVDWTVPSSPVILNVTALETDIQTALGQDLGQRPAVDCGSLYRLNLPSESFECNVIGDPIAGRDRIPAVTVKIDAQGNLNWQEIRYVAPAVSTTDSLESSPSTPEPADATADDSD